MRRRWGDDGGQVAKSAAAIRGTRARRRSPSIRRGSRWRWLLVRSRVARMCCVCAPRQVQVPPETFRFTTAGRSACSAREVNAEHIVMQFWAASERKIPSSCRKDDRKHVHGCVPAGRDRQSRRQGPSEGLRPVIGTRCALPRQPGMPVWGARRRMRPPLQSDRPEFGHTSGDMPRLPSTRVLGRGALDRATRPFHRRPIASASRSGGPIEAGRRAWRRQASAVVRPASHPADPLMWEPAKDVRSREPGRP